MREGPDATSKALVPSFGILRHVRYEHLVAGVSGGVIATLLLHPLDLVKIRFQGEHTINTNSDHLLIT